MSTLTSAMNAAAILMKIDCDLKLLYLHNYFFSVTMDGYGMFK